MKKTSLITIMLVALFCFPLVTYAASNEQINAADSLHDLGLFSGVGNNADGTPNYALDREPTRAESVTMLVRLLGKEEEAKSKEWNTPFNDVADWAKPYVGYAYNNGLTSGTSSTTFGGSSKVTASQYLTFVLRALGYNSGTDFQWDKAWELSDKIGITNGQYNENSGFTRGDTAVVSNNSLSASLKGSDKTLIESLDITPVEEEEEVEVEFEVPLIVDKNINAYLLSLNPDECYEAGMEDGTIWHMVWNNKNLYDELTQYMQALPNYELGEKDWIHENSMLGEFTKIEIMDPKEEGQKSFYAIEWFSGGRSIANYFYLVEDGIRAPSIMEISTIGDKEINEELLLMNPHQLEKSKDGKLYHITWFDGTEQLYNEICGILDNSKNYTSDGEFQMTPEHDVTAVTVEICVGHNTNLQYNIAFLDGINGKISYYYRKIIENPTFGDSKINSKLLALSPDYSEEVDENEFHKICWNNNNKELFETICDMFESSGNYKSVEDTYDTVINSEEIWVEISYSLPDNPEIGYIYSYFVSLFDGKGKAKGIEYVDIRQFPSGH